MGYLEGTKKGVPERHTLCGMDTPKNSTVPALWWPVGRYSLVQLVVRPKSGMPTYPLILSLPGETSVILLV
jgi:hypothetical protein